jgi:uncharacterized damage-inducible protein DinB
MSLLISFLARKETPVKRTSFAAALVLPIALAVLPAAAEEKASAPAAAPAAEAKLPANPGTAGLGGVYVFVQRNLVKAAEKVPEELYGFKPTADVRTFGQLVGHVADAQFMMCSLVLGEKAAPRNVEKTKTAKTDLVDALKESCALCERAYKVSDADAAKPVEIFGMKMNGFGVLGLALAHGYEHYGNMTTYMRIKAIVPPSSEGRPPMDPHKSAEKTPEKY